MAEFGRSVHFMLSRNSTNALVEGDDPNKTQTRIFDIGHIMFGKHNV